MQKLSDNKLLELWESVKKGKSLREVFIPFGFARVPPKRLRKLISENEYKKFVKYPNFQKGCQKAAGVIKTYWTNEKREERKKQYTGENNPNYKNGRSFQVRCGIKGRGNKMYIKGKRNEKKAKTILEKSGYWVVSAAGSKGIFDLCAINNIGLRLIQVKTNANASLEERETIQLFRNCPLNCSKEIWIFYDFKQEPEIIIL